MAPLISPRRRQSLLDKVSGPNAVPITALVARGEAASRRVQEKFDDFLKLRVSELEDMSRKLTGEAAPAASWERFYAVVHDVKGSSALAGKLAVNRFCLSLIRLLEERDYADPRMGTAIASHINALNLVVSHGAPDAAAQALLVSELSRAIDSLPLKKREFKAV
jgi:hypothetical protein